MEERTRPAKTDFRVELDAVDTSRSSISQGHQIMLQSTVSAFENVPNDQIPLAAIPTMTSSYAVPQIVSQLGSITSNTPGTSASASQPSSSTSTTSNPTAAESRHTDAGPFEAPGADCSIVLVVSPMESVLNHADSAYIERDAAAPSNIVSAESAAGADDALASEINSSSALTASQDDPITSASNYSVFPWALSGADSDQLITRIPSATSGRMGTRHQRRPALNTIGFLNQPSRSFERGTAAIHNNASTNSHRMLDPIPEGTVVDSQITGPDEEIDPECDCCGFCGILEPVLKWFGQCCWWEAPSGKVPYRA